jgi:hypothetical protein
VNSSETHFWWLEDVEPDSRRFEQERLYREATGDKEWKRGYDKRFTYWLVSRTTASLSR